MDRVVLATWGSCGDVHPFIALALDLRKAGYLPVIACSEQYRHKVVSEGLLFEPVRPDERDVQRHLGIDDAEVVRRYSLPGTAGMEFIVRSQLLPYLRQTYDDMLRASAQAHLIITSTFAYAATLAAQKLGVPHVHIALQPVVFGPVGEPAAIAQLPELLRHRTPQARATHDGVQTAAGDFANWAAPIHALRREIGLPPTTANPLLRGQFSQYANIGLYSRILGDVQPHFPARTTVAGFAFYDRDGGIPKGAGEELAHFLASGSAPVVFALGSQAVNAPGDFFDIGANAAHILQRRAVFVVGPAAPQTSGRDRPRDTFSITYAPYSDLFRRAAAIVHHGGIGTTGQALRSGRPQLIIPFFGDQYDNAQRVVRLGVGRTIPRHGASAAAVATELDLLLRRQDYAQRASGVSLLVQQEDGAAAATQIILNLLRVRPEARHRS